MSVMAPCWRDAYHGRGMPMVAVECTLGFERITSGGGEEDLRKYVAGLLPGHYVTVGVTEAEKVPSPLDGERCTFTKRQWWILAAARAYFRQAIPSGNPTGAVEQGLAADVKDSDMDRAQGYWYMPQTDQENWRPVGREIGGAYRVADIAQKPSNMGTGGFPTKVTDPGRGNAPTITSGSRGGWIVDEITGVPVVRQWTLREIARGCRIRDGGINPSYLALWVVRCRALPGARPVAVPAMEAWHGPPGPRGAPGGPF